jgi:hypothetical protein
MAPHRTTLAKRNETKRSTPAMQYRPGARLAHSLILFNPCLFLQTPGVLASNLAPARVS